MELIVLHIVENIFNYMNKSSKGAPGMWGSPANELRMLNLSANGTKWRPHEKTPTDQTFSLRWARSMDVLEAASERMQGGGAERATVTARDQCRADPGSLDGRGGSQSPPRDVHRQAPRWRNISQDRDGEPGLGEQV